MDLKTNH